jgi:glycosyltransferase involved in cell wall biosynthesis
MENSRCKISVIIPVFNTEKYLQRCVDSVLSQTFSDFELILVDDCSTDGSPAICDEYARKDARVKVIHNAQNQGSSKARKTGLDAASGDYVLFVDSDDWVESDMLEAMYGKAADENLDMVYCGFYYNTDTEQTEAYIPEFSDKIEMLKHMLTTGKFPVTVWNKLTKREIYQKVIFPTVSIGEDKQINVQIMYYSEIGGINKSLYHYYYNTNSLVHSAEILKVYTDHMEIETWVIQFLQDKFNNNLSIFEPELSVHINSIKLRFILEKSIRYTSKLHELYPISNNKIFDKTWKELFCKKVILFLAVNHFTIYFFLDMIDLLIKILRKIYHVLIPSNIRSFIWEKRNKEESA